MSRRYVDRDTGPDSVRTGLGAVAGTVHVCVHSTNWLERLKRPRPAWSSPSHGLPTSAGRANCWVRGVQVIRTVEDPLPSPPSAFGHPAAGEGRFIHHTVFRRCRTMVSVENDRPHACPEHPDLRDYVGWHTAYDDPDSSLSVRLRHVQGAIHDWLDRTPGPVRVLSSCAGQGHDILGALEQRSPVDRARVTGTLIEIDPTNVTIAKRRIADLGVALSVLEADAGTSEVYAGLLPADLVLLSGIMGNISPADIEHLVRLSPGLCTSGATVIWTRGAQDPDLGPDIRRWFCQAGFEELSCQEWIEGTGLRVGVNRLVAAPRPLNPSERIFTFYR